MLAEFDGKHVRVLRLSIVATNILLLRITKLNWIWKFQESRAVYK